MTNIWIFALESLDNRYSKQWYTFIPKSLEQLARQQNIKMNIITIDGVQHSSDPLPGAFLDFTDTNYYKSTQLAKFIEYFKEGKTTVNDVFLFCDFWNPCILQVSYRRDLMDQKWRLHSIAHAGEYDPTDILWLKMQKPWPWHLERSIYYACDKNWFATEFHKRMFLSNLSIVARDEDRSGVSGQPHDAIIKSMNALPVAENKKGVIWPHRYNSDKQPEMAENLASVMDVPWLLTQKLNLDKERYYQTLAEHQVLFSCSLHENLGISVMEGVLADVIPVLPRRCSYQDMYLDDFLYPAKWTESWQQFLAHREQLSDFIMHRVNNPHRYQDAMKRQKQLLLDRYLQADVMYTSMLQDIVTANKMQ